MTKRFRKVFKKRTPKKSKKNSKNQNKKTKKKSKKEKRAPPSFFLLEDSFSNFNNLNELLKDSNESQEINIPNDLNILEPVKKNEQIKNSFSEDIMG